MTEAQEYSSGVGQKITASWINMGVVVVASLPLLWFVDEAIWKLITIAAFFAYNVIFATSRCIGMRCADTFNTSSKFNLPYIVLYTAGFSTLFYWVLFPADLFLLNGVAQAICLSRTGNTLHGWLSNYSTVNVVGHLINMEVKQGENR